jgi:hypothetical protein
MKRLAFIAIIMVISKVSYPQVFSGNEVLKWTTWAAVQAIPSITYFDDNNGTDSRLQFGLRWHIVPLNYSFNANKLVSPVQLFKVNPVRRLGGSLEAFVQPEWTTKNYELADLKRFSLSTGVRAFIPVIESGEYLALSVGGKYSFRRSKGGVEENTPALELGAYTFFGILGIQFNYNLKTPGRYNIGLYVKYY